MIPLKHYQPNTRPIYTTKKQTDSQLGLTSNLNNISALSAGLSMFP